MTGLFRPRYSFLTNNSWQTTALNALRYNTSQVGSVVAMVYGTVRQSINLLAIGNYIGPGGGKKGKGVGSLPIGGTTQQAKGGGGGKKGGKKAVPDYTIDIDFGVCEGPVSIQANNGVYADGMNATFNSLPLNFYSGLNGQAPDGTMAGLGFTVGYSGTCHITATPMNLGPTPVIPNIAFEINGLLAGSSPISTLDADPAAIIQHFLTDPQLGAGFPLVNLDTAATLPNLSAYCAAIGFTCSTILDAQQTGVEWLSGFLQMINTTMVWSGDLLTLWPLAEQTIGTWNPNLVAQYALTDDDVLFERQAIGGDILILNDDPITTTRLNPTDIPNWFSIEYLDRFNYYNSTILSAFDQTSINLYGLRIGDGLNGKQFSNPANAGASVQTILQRRQYVLNTFRFKLGWKYSLLEPMDVVLLSGKTGDNYLNNQAVRITQIEEDDNGDLTITGEEITQGSNHPFQPPAGNYAPWHFNNAFSAFPPWYLGRQATVPHGGGSPSIVNTWTHPNFSEDTGVFTLSCWIKPQLSGMVTLGNDPSTNPPNPENPVYDPTDPWNQYSSIFAAWGSGSLYWDGTVASGDYIAGQNPIPPSFANPMYCFTSNGQFPPLSVGFRGTGEFVIQISAYKQHQMPNDPHGWTTVGTGGWGFAWNPWQPYASIRLVSGGGGDRIGFGSWQHFYLRYNGGDWGCFINGRSVNLVVDPRYSYSYFAPQATGPHNTLGTDPLGENAYFNVLIVPPEVGWHSAIMAGFTMNSGLLYYMPGFAGCITDCWFSRQVDLGDTGYNYFMLPGTTFATPTLGSQGQIPMILSGHSGLLPDIYHHNFIGDSETDLFQASINHATPSTDYGYGYVGFEGAAVPDACVNGPWFGTLS